MKKSIMFFLFGISALWEKKKQNPNQKGKQANKSEICL